MRKNIQVDDLYVDFEDGFVLSNLLQIISNGGIVGEKGNKFKFAHDKKKYKRLFIRNRNPIALED